MWNAVGSTGEGKTNFGYSGNQGALQVMGESAQIRAPEKARENLYLHPIPSKAESSGTAGWMDQHRIIKIGKDL